MAWYKIANFKGQHSNADSYCHIAYDGSPIGFKPLVKNGFVCDENFYGNIISPFQCWLCCNEIIGRLEQ